MSRKARNQTIDLARVFFIFAVFLCHTHVLCQPGENIPAIMCYGFLGVEFFFIVSGYLMAAKAANEKSRALGPATMRFIRKKFGSIIPFYFAAWVLAMIVLNWGTAWETVRVNVIRALPNLLLLGSAGFTGYQALPPTWYLSAMLLSMLMLYPLLLYFKKTFTCVIAPLVCFFCYGYCFMKVGNLATIDAVEGGFVQTGLLRRSAGISLGTMCYEEAQRFTKLELNGFAKLLVGIVELSAYTLAFLSMRTQTLFRPDFVFVCLTAIGITASFSGQSCFRFTSSHAWLGRFSLCFYLADPIGRNLAVMMMPAGTRAERFWPCLGITIYTACTILLLGGALKLLGHGIRKGAGKCLLKKSSQ